MIKNLLDSDEDPRAAEQPRDTGGFFGSGPEVIDIFDTGYGDSPGENTQGDDQGVKNSVDRPAPLKYTPPNAGQTIRMTGLAWSAGISLFGSIVFMLILGWFADLLFGISPWGIVGGIVFGAVIGFVQFFRINSEILKTAKGNKSDDSDKFLN
jgi:F0F1-type ATP synthase assembly protein I